HSTAGYALEVARQAGARRLVLFHHDPGHDDAWIDASTSRTREQCTSFSDGSIEVLAASEGMRLRSGG
ncbi:MAG: MBL fold metallo-hydrolase, partial [Actinomycetota bacterium]|nr:MBL fold metallo-hydrolase [Actinomycetota bacterium]